jgi:hypothetical protein
MPRIATAPGVHASPGGLGGSAPATDPSGGGTLTRPRHTRARHTGIIRPVGTPLIAAVSLLLAGCTHVSCGPCPPPVSVAIVDVRPDPERVLRVCADIGRPCVELRIMELVAPSGAPSAAVRELMYSCVASDEAAWCNVDRDTVYLGFHRLAAKDVSGKLVDVTAAGGRSADKQGSDVFHYSPEDSGPCSCDYSYARVRLGPDREFLRPLTSDTARSPPTAGRDTRARLVPRRPSAGHRRDALSAVPQAARK